MEQEIDFESRQKYLLKGAAFAPIAGHFGMKLSFNDENEAIWTLPFNKNLTNGLTTHGGAIGTMLDCAGWFTIAQYFETWIATVEFHTRLLSYSKNEDLVATGKVVRLGKRISTASMEVCTKSEGKLIAVGSGTYSVTSEPLPPL